MQIHFPLSLDQRAVLVLHYYANLEYPLENPEGAEIHALIAPHGQST